MVRFRDFASEPARRARRDVALTARSRSRGASSIGFGEPMADVEVTATDARTGQGTRALRTDDPALPVFELAPGTYRVCATANGGVRGRPKRQSADPHVRASARAKPRPTRSCFAREVTASRFASSAARPTAFLARSSTLREPWMAESASSTPTNAAAAPRPGDRRPVLRDGVLPGESSSMRRCGGRQSREMRPRRPIWRGDAESESSRRSRGLTITTTRAATLGGRVIFEGRLRQSLDAAWRCPILIRCTSSQPRVTGRRGRIGPPLHHRRTVRANALGVRTCRTAGS